MPRRSALVRSAKGEDGYEVGYGKPPKNTRFKPGQSGNPKGRPPGQRNLRTVVKEVLKEKITIREGERTRTVSRLDAIVRVTINNALKGDLKALAAFIQLMRPTGLMDEDPESSSREAVGAQDHAILAEFLARHGIAEEQDSREEVPSAEAELAEPQPDAKPANEAEPRAKK
jgi:hypothetical protein